MNTELQNKLETCVKNILKYDADKKFAAKKVDDYKEELTELCDSAYAEIFDNDGQCELINANALVKTSLNPPKVIFINTDKSLTPSDRADLAKLLIANNLDSFTVLDISIKDLLIASDKDKKLKKLLKDKKIKFEQDSRYEVKTLPKKSK